MCAVKYTRNGYEMDYNVKSGYTAVACGNTRFIKTKFFLFFVLSENNHFFRLLVNKFSWNNNKMHTILISR